ncbi:hypothetical protein FHX42_001870 [Saccharopolyspora lacisalsi]|uniref:Uncharacterized protein n=1 Tax=Halosaccharopolyspora lacisalsi TaxID=1000566 RepID=A0A839DU06_9PSEU|nr:hypothetical protein [Halosaccharopolyspora lacisalsi]MBA8824523.1 hypothetical protein [Halosaccharopolyspora lacisalsi]
MEFDHRAEVVNSDGGGWGSFGSAERAARLFSHTGEVRLVRSGAERLSWFGGRGVVTGHPAHRRQAART